MSAVCVPGDQVKTLGKVQGCVPLEPAVEPESLNLGFLKTVFSLVLFVK